MISGGATPETHRRRFRTKLIARECAGMTACSWSRRESDDMDEFFDVLHEEPLDQWYEIGNVSLWWSRASGGHTFTGGGVPAGVAGGKCRLAILSKCDTATEGAAAEYDRAFSGLIEQAPRALQAAGGSENFVRGRRTAPRSEILLRFSPAVIISQAMRSRTLRRDRRLSRCIFLDMHLDRRCVYAAVKKMLKDPLRTYFPLKDFCRIRMAHGWRSMQHSRRSRESRLQTGRTF